MVGKYDRTKINEMIPEFAGQEALFKDYALGLGDSKVLEELKEEINLTEQELQEKNVKSVLAEAGLNTETIEAIATETKYHKNLNRLDEVEIQGEQVGERYSVIFWCDTIEDFNYLNEIFQTSRKYNANTAMLLAFCKKYLKTFKEEYEAEKMENTNQENL